MPNLKLPAWLRRPDAPQADLDHQLEASQAAHAAALEDVERARATWDAVGDASSLAALDKARADAALLGEHVERARRIADAAQRAAAEAEHTALVHRADELEGSLRESSLAVERLPYEEREVRLLEQLIELRCERMQLELSFGTRRAELQRLRDQLGLPERYAVAAPPSLYSRVISERVTAMARAALDPVRRHVVFALSADVTPQRLMQAAE